MKSYVSSHYVAFMAVFFRRRCHLGSNRPRAPRIETPSYAAPAPRRRCFDDPCAVPFRQQWKPIVVRPLRSTHACKGCGADVGKGRVGPQLAGPWGQLGPLNFNKWSLAVG